MCSATPSSTANNHQVLNGIAFDEGTGRLFVTGKWWPAIFEIETEALDNSPAAASTRGEREDTS